MIYVDYNMLDEKLQLRKTYPPSNICINFSDKWKLRKYIATNKALRNNIWLIKVKNIRVVKEWKGMCNR